MERKESALGGGLRGWGGGGGDGETLVALAEMFAGAFDGEALLVEEAFDFEDEFDVFAAVLALVGAGFFGAEAVELGFPIAEDVGFNAGEAGDLAYFEIELIGDVGGGDEDGFTDAVRGGEGVFPSD